MQGASESDTSGPADTKYYSSVDNGVYYLYQFYDDGNYEDHLGQPLNMENLSDFQINPNELSESSAAAFRQARFNFTTNDTVSLLESMLSDRNSTSPLSMGSAFPGTWTFPVCDTGSYNWNSQYEGANPSLSPLLSCCCGHSCQDTKDFVNATNLLGKQTYLLACNLQLKNTTLDFDSIDYGFQYKEVYNT